MTIKSKAFKFLLGIAVVLGVAVSASLASAADFGTATLRVGSRGAAVMEVQKVVGATPVDGIFGPMTMAAVKAWQANNGLVADGVVGNATKAAMNAVSGVVAPSSGCQAGWIVNPFTNQPCGTTTPTTPSTPSVLEGEEADLTLDADAEDDLTNNKSGQHAFTIEIEADDRGGDAKVERMDLEFSITKTGGEDDIYDIIEAISLEVDGDEIASVDTDSRSDWRDGKTIRLSGLDIVVKSGKTVEVEVLLDIADLDATDLEIDLKLSNVAIRYSDASGITDVIDKNFTEEVTIEDIDSIEFDADETKPDNPASVTVSLNEDRDDVVVLVNDIEVDGQDGTIEEAVVTFTLQSGTIANQVALDALVDEVYLNGDKADDIESLSTTTFSATFDMDEMEVEVGDEFEVEITVDFKKDATATQTLKVTNITFEGEGYDGDDFSENVTPDDAPLVTLTSGALVLVSSEVTGYTAVGSNMQVAKATFEVELENEGDKDISLGVWDSTASPAALILTDAFVFEIAGSDVAATDVVLGYTVSIKNEGDTLDAANAVIKADESMTYLVTVTIDANANILGTAEYGIKLADIKYTIDDKAVIGTYDEDDTLRTLIVNLEAEEIDLIKNK